MYPEQAIVDVGLGLHRRWSKTQKESVASLHPIMQSEIIRDIEWLFS